MQNIHEILKQYYGYNAFRPLQEDIIQSVLSGKDTLALLPTGGGKSVCYQVPAMAQQGMCLVVTPLIALMKDQMLQLKKRGISVLGIYSGMAFYEVKKALQNATSGNFKFLFVSPERLQTKQFLEYLPAMPICLIAVDEAHCISQWGYDFRPPYLQIASIRQELEDVPILALTASATSDVQLDICNRLGFKQHNIFRQSFAKPNLSFSCFNTPHKINKLYNVLNNVGGTSLVYVRNRRKTKEIARLLQMNNINATFYHAGLTNDERNQRQEDWLGNKVRVMVCTNAFGMGIDKPDVRTVVHMDVPDCLESYYQEAGRAGRDGKKSYAVLLYNDDEIAGLEKLTDKKFPPIDVIRKYYEATCNYIQVPVGSGEGMYFNFDLAACSERFNLEPLLLVNVLHTLEQAGYVSFSENVFLPSKAGFVTSKENLYEFENQKPSFEPLIKALLRSYEGIFDNVVNISEKAVAKFLKQIETAVIEQLQELARYNIILYQPKKDSPQIFFLYNRVTISQLVINTKQYEERKQLYKRKVQEMIRYANNTNSCRSGFIRQYFDDTNIEPCGICDVCLSKKKLLITDKELTELSNKILQQLIKPETVHQLQQLLKTPLAKIELAIAHLESEEKIVWNDKGELILKPPV